MTDASPLYRPTAWRWMRYVVLTAAALLLLYPVLWMVMASLKPEDEIFSQPAALPGSLDWANYVEGWTGTGRSFGVYLLNSALVSTLSVVGNVLACSMAAYVFARLDFPFRRTLFAVMLVTIMLPFQVTLIPQYTLFRELGWLDTYLPLVVPKFLAVDAFFIFLMVQFIRGIPRELDEAARIDGCGPIRTFRRVIFPLLTPALVTTAIFTFIWTFDDFFGQLVYISSPSLFTVPLGLRVFIDTTGQSAYGPMLAMAVLALIPVVVFFLFFQKRLVSGLATSGLKG
ncbi:binding-protein-dependent transport systems inner membrane component [Beutenbergia cavernae DSM 12333]|uniref:Binding-protein-dependent transport systems inner membrane component n=1 Tax=Beutenbergia cavernae (strain ATCC BAA-8 / DSM 12333 / CCUG 43141 / JCM 11478 / NBRC 16432 / NCIMB 13614 / HKI 0122) TaxID=471853 RepID=C5BZL0_BEUC1|nr:carbohydrate ABC transporter permease [Beutenbergia cavernae]ACQ79182.1 binding-protein-dependent transport systems inner membrane component [Beutenbergia cavernae DSM 12333]